MHRAGKKPRTARRRLLGVALAGSFGRRGFYSPGEADPTPGTDNIITDGGELLVTADGDHIIRRG